MSIFELNSRLNTLRTLSEKEGGTSLDEYRSTYNELSNHNFLSKATTAASGALTGLFIYDAYATAKEQAELTTKPFEKLTIAEKYTKTLETKPGSLRASSLTGVLTLGLGLFTLYESNRISKYPQPSFKTKS